MRPRSSSARPLIVGALRLDAGPLPQVGLFGPEGSTLIPYRINRN